MGKKGLTSRPGAGELLLLYDGACPLCAREIAHYQGLSPVAPVRFVDVSAMPEGDLGCGIDRRSALARLHAVESDGTVVSGARAFIALWKCMPGWRWLARVTSGPMVLWLLERAYRGFLKARPFLQAWARRGNPRAG